MTELVEMENEQEEKLNTFYEPIQNSRLVTENTNDECNQVIMLQYPGR